MQQTGTMAPIDAWTHLERRGESEAVDVRPLAIASERLDAARFVTAVVTDAEHYKVLLWTIESHGAVKLLDSADGGPTTRVAVANLPNAVRMLGHAAFVTAARTEAGALKVTAWDVDAAGALTRRGSGETGEIHGEFALTSAFGLTFVTACRDSDDRLTLISWSRAADGSITRLETTRGEVVREIALATYDSYPPAVFPIVTAVTTLGRRGATNDLKLIAWRIDTGGSFTRLGEVDAGTAQEVAAASLSYRRVVTAARTPGDALEVRTWDFDADGQITEHASGAIATIGAGDFGLATRSAARILTAVPDGGGRLTLVSWDGVDGVVRLGHARADPSDLLTVVTLGSDWIVTPVRTAAGALKVIVWLEHGVSLLRGEWRGIPQPPAPQAITPIAAEQVQVEMEVSGEDDPAPGIEPDHTTEQRDQDDGTSGAPALSAPWVPGVEGIDAMVSVGFDFVIVSQDHAIGFFDKQMNLLGTATSKEFFGTLLTGTSADGSPNEDCINRHLGCEPGSAVATYPPGPTVYCDPEASGRRPVCISGNDAFFDMRSHFDPTSRRFFVAASVRSGCKCVLPTTGECTDNDDKAGINTNKADNPLVRRYFAFAISKTEDPRDGFDQWITTEAGRTYDHPLTAVNDGVMVLMAGPSEATFQTHPFGMKPKVFVFSVEDMLAGRRHLRSHKLLAADVLVPTESRLIPLRHYGNTGGRTFFVRPESTAKTIFVYSFRNPSDWSEFPPLEMAPDAADLGVDVHAPDDTGFFRDGKIYFAWHKLHPAEGGSSTRYSIRLVCVPLLALATNPVPSVNPADGFFYRVFGIRSSSDGPQDLISYVQPDAVVNGDGHVVVAFARVGSNVALAPEARYKVFYADGRGDSGSQLLKAGNYLPTKTPDQYLDYQTSAIDPSDDRTVWMMSVFASIVNRKSSYRAVVAKLVP